MASYSILVLPPNSNNMSTAEIQSIVDTLTGKILCDPPICFDRDAKQPRGGFDITSAEITNYGFKSKYLFEEEIFIPMVDQEKREFKKIVIEGKFIRDQGIVLIGTTSDTLLKPIARKWLDALFPDRIIPHSILTISQHQLDNFIEKHARTVIDISHSQVKGLEKIRMHAYDLPNKTWYKDEGFGPETISQITFIPKLTGELAKKTPICRIYKSGKMIIYQNSNYTDAEFENITIQLVTMLSDILGSPLCKKGPGGSQGRLK